MLTLSRKENEWIRIGDDIRIVVVRIRGDSVRLGFEADRQIRIVREELLDRDAGESTDGEANEDRAFVRCPCCSRPQPRRGPDSLYWCEHCQGQFDDSPMEGGDYSAYNPSWRLEREERRAKKKRIARTRR